MGIRVVEALALLVGVTLVGCSQADDGRSTSGERRPDPVATEVASTPWAVEVCDSALTRAGLADPALAPSTDGFRLEIDGSITSPGLRSPGVAFDRLAARLMADACAGSSVGVAGFERWTLRITRPAAAVVPALVHAGRVVYESAFPATDLVVIAGSGRYEELYVLRDASAPSEFAWRVQLPSGLPGVRRDAVGGVVFADGRGEARLRVPPVVAVDAQGARRDGWLRWTDGEIAFGVDTAGLEFPVVLDPALETEIWELRSVARPSGECPVAYDSARQRTVILGVAGETWEWDGISWDGKAVLGPVLEDAAMVYDVARGRTVLFGGLQNNTTYKNDTWLWDGTSWSLTSPAAKPGARANHALAYDPVRARVVLHGGENSGGPLGDTWEWDGTTWAQRCTTAPCNTTTPGAITAHAMTYDPVRARTLLFAGIDLWEWDGTTWVRRCFTGCADPTPTRTEATLTFDVARGVAVLHGGDGPVNQLQDTWEWNGTSWTLKAPVANPGDRYQHGAVYDVARGNVVVFGGRATCGTCASPGDLWTYDGTTWVSKPLAATPDARSLHGFAYDSARGVSVLFGGWGRDGELTDTWEWNGTAWSRPSPGTSPTAYEGPAMAYDAARSQTVLFGGRASPGSPLNETWIWNGTAWTLKNPATKAFGRQYAGMAFDSVRGRTVLFGGGYPNLSFLNDTWEWDGTTWLQRCTAAPCSTTKPGARVGPALAFDAVRGKVVLFGGYDYTGTTYYDDTWEWDGTTWSQKSPVTKPPKRVFASMASESGRARTLLFGGRATYLSSTAMTDEWEWDGTTWTQRTPSTIPPGRSDHTLVYDSQRHRAMMYGGNSSGTRNGELWEHHVRGGACFAASDCESGSCVDGVCCDTSSCASCQACNLANPGVCTPIVSTTDPDSCTGTQSCNASGMCVLIDGQACSTGSQCLSTQCVDGVCCNTACNGACDVCAVALGASANGVCSAAIDGYAGSPACLSYACNGTTTTCSATTCAQDLYCQATHYCASDATCKSRKGNASVCDADAGDDCLLSGCRVCTSGNCVDGYCCSSNCAGSCNVCNSTPGTCTNAAAGALGSPDCGNYACTGATSTCGTGCTADAQCDAAAAFCRTASGTCDAKLSNGAACNQGSWCQSGNCVDGACCDSPCAGNCQACTALLKGSGSDGSCGFAASGKDPHGNCPDDGAASCDRDGYCDGAGSCRLYALAVSCGGTTCSGNSVTGQICNGFGACVTDSTGTPCAPYECAGGACKNPCSVDSDCTAGNFCDGGTCRVKQAPGLPCAGANQCQLGYCVDGYCCNGPCTGACDVCSASLGASANGTCSPAPAGASGTPSCNDYVCNGTATLCPVNCSGDAQCSASAYCAAGGTCKPRKGQAQTCAAADCLVAGCNVCSSGNCADGYCCDTACAGACDSCSITPGACSNSAVGAPGSPSCGSYLCTGGLPGCGTSCSGDGQCSTGAWCRSSGATCQTDQANGAACSSASQCQSGQCVDGVCCNTACNTACQACTALLKTSGVDGLCGDAADGKDPHDDCTDQGQVSCGSDGLCDGSGSCRKYGAGVACGGTTCSGNLVKGQVCDGLGSCGNEVNGIDCTPYVCSSGACQNPCSGDGDCTTGSFCDAGTCRGKLGVGNSCAATSWCQSGNCVDGVCCNAPCAGACDTCSTGTCLAAANGSAGNPSCAPYRCDGASNVCPTTCTSDAACTSGAYCASDGTCHVQKGQGQTCSLAAGGADCLGAGCRVCASGNCVDGYCCDAACAGSCDVCSLSAGACTPSSAASPGSPSCDPYLCSGQSAGCGSSCGSDAQCAATAWCRSSDGTCQDDQPAGVACAAGTQCQSGHCVDGVCCNGPCTQLCQACTAALKGGGQDGTCGNAEVGRDPHADCAPTSPDTCQEDGSCDGAGGCRRWTLGVACGSTSCQGNLVKGRVCDGSGTCIDELSGLDCAPYACTLGSCPGFCATDAQCVPGNFCDAGTCRSKKLPGEVCVSQNECASGFCVEGVCCDTACNGKCQSCRAAEKASGADGVCAEAADGHDPHADCADEGPASCRQDGQCNGNGECRRYAAGVVCGATACVGNTQTGYSCNGSGTCLPGSTTDCLSYACVNGACNTSCAASTDCATAAWCDNSVCQAKGSAGAACTAGDQCSGNICVDGVCCNRGCAGQCEACDEPGTEGTCTPVVGAPRNARAACATAPAGSPCQQAQCDGTETTSCAGYVGTGVVCVAASCAGGVASLELRCDGHGSCPAAATKSCEPYVCGATTCADTCVTDAECASGYGCDVASGKCISGSSCDGDHTVVSPTGQRKDCAPYVCEGARCKDTCAAVEDCVAPAVCDPSHHCVVRGGAAAADEGGCGCRAVVPAARTPWALVVALIALVGRRRRPGPARASWRA